MRFSYPTNINIFVIRQYNFIYIPIFFCFYFLYIHNFNHTPRWRKLAACAQFRIQNSQFKIPLALFRAHYRLKKRLSLWYIKENSRVVLLYCVDFQCRSCLNFFQRSKSSRKLVILCVAKKEHQNSGTLCKDTINNWIITFLSVKKKIQL